MSELLRAANTRGLVLPGVVVADCDLVDAQALELGCALFVWQGDDVLLEGTCTYPLQTMTARVVGAFSLSDAGQKLMDGFPAHWHAATGASGFVLNDLSSTAVEARAAAAAQVLIKTLTPAFSALARHNADLLQMLAQLRIAHEVQGIALRKREQLLLSQAQSKRWLVQSHGPLATGREAALCLMPGGIVQQRLKLGSEGLSDLALFVPAQPIPGEGCLTARLRLAESGDLAAEWTIKAEALVAGWLRLSLITTLSDDIQTAQLELQWQSQVPLWLGAGLQHPDPALCARIDGLAQGQILAHKVWTFLADCSPPMPVDGHCQTLSSTTNAVGTALLHLDPAHLEQALEGDPETPCLLFHRDQDALQVHPQPDVLSAARLPGAVPSGVVTIAARIGGLSPICPVIEYALAVVPRHPLRPLADLVIEAAGAGRLSDWVRRDGDIEGDVSLLLPEAPPEARDLLLITRVPLGQTTAYGWATFRDIWMSP